MLHFMLSLLQSTPFQLALISTLVAIHFLMQNQESGKETKAKKKPRVIEMLEKHKASNRNHFHQYDDHTAKRELLNAYADHHTRDLITHSVMRPTKRGNRNNHGKKNSQKTASAPANAAEDDGENKDPISNSHNNQAIEPQRVESTPNSSCNQEVDIATTAALIVPPQVAEVTLPRRPAPTPIPMLELSRQLSHSLQQIQTTESVEEDSSDHVEEAVEEAVAVVDEESLKEEEDSIVCASVEDETESVTASVTETGTETDTEADIEDCECDLTANSHVKACIESELYTSYSGEGLETLSSNDSETGDSVSMETIELQQQQQLQSIVSDESDQTSTDVVAETETETASKKPRHVKVCVSVLPVYVVKTYREMKRAVKHILMCPEIAIDCEGINMMRIFDMNAHRSVEDEPQLSLIQVSVPQIGDKKACTYIIDAVSLIQRKDRSIKDPDKMTKTKFARFLAEFMEAENIVKVIHDGRNDSFTLYCQFGVTLKRAFDTQVAVAMWHYTKMDPIDQQSAAIYRSGLNTMLEEMSLPGNPHKEHMKHRWSTEGVAFIMDRPLVSDLLKYAAEDVSQLLPAFRALCEKLGGRSDELVDKLAMLSKAYYDDYVFGDNEYRSPKFWFSDLYLSAQRSPRVAGGNGNDRSKPQQMNHSALSQSPPAVAVYNTTAAVTHGNNNSSRRRGSRNNSNHYFSDHIAYYDFDSMFAGAGSFYYDYSGSQMQYIHANNNKTMDRMASYDVPRTGSSSSSSNNTSTTSSPETSPRHYRAKSKHSPQKQQHQQQQQQYYQQQKQQQPSAVQGGRRNHWEIHYDAQQTKKMHYTFRNQQQH